MPNSEFVAHKRAVRRQWLRAWSTQAIGQGLVMLALASFLATGAYTTGILKNREPRTRNPVLAMGLLLSFVSYRGSKALQNQADLDWSEYDYLNQRTSLIVEVAAKLDAEAIWCANTILDAVNGTVDGSFSAAAPDGPIVEQSTLLPTRDVVGAIALRNGHTCIVAKPRCGKTTLMLDCIHWDMAMGRHVILIDGKGDYRLKQLQGVAYLQVNQPDQVPELISIMDSLLRMLNDRQNGALGSQIALWVNDHDLVRSAAADYAESSKQLNNEFGMEVEQDYLEILERVFLQGADVRIYARLCCQTSRLADLGFQEAELKAAAFVALGRQGRNESIEDLLRYHFKGVTKMALQRQVKQFTAQADLLGDTPLILTTMNPQKLCLPKPSRVELPTSAPLKWWELGQNIRQKLERVWQQSPSLPSGGVPVKREENPLASLLSYISQTGPVTHGEILQGWAGDWGVNAQQLKQLLGVLTISHSVIVSEQGYELPEDSL